MVISKQIKQYARLIMKVLVCVKALPQTDHGVISDEATGKIIPVMPSGYRLNSWDSCAVEAAIRLKESGKADQVDVITCGTPEADSALKRALGMGASNAIHIVHTEEEPDSLTVAKKITEAIGKKGGYDLIICGAMSEDRMEAATGPMIAALLGIPFAASIVEMEVAPEDKFIRVAVEMDGGLRQLVRLELPCLVTMQTGINTPRYPKLSAMLRASQAEIETMNLGIFSPKQKTTGFRQPEASRKARFLQGSTQEKASEVIRLMKEKGLLNTQAARS